ncbi:MAG: hypothetical protein PHH54_04260 [Candidatus Nanoarchaeia archaeon]|nr:hypothetical protein [Candidatus Nanoarchaeia archaeon]MDD5741174.1 hypothetical protein [Candidatus Nanoarchaeia archaeon]
MGIESLPLIRNLENFAQGLPKECRAKAYEFAKSFYVVGVGDGAAQGVVSDASMIAGMFSGKKSKDSSSSYFGDKEKELKDYLDKKIQESK